MKKVITYGTFDLFHIGHLNILKRAKALGDYLIVAVSSDKFNELKGKKAYHSIDERVEILKAITYVDEVIIEESWDQKLDDIKKHHIDVFVMGDDWEGKFDDLQDYCEVVYLPRTEGVSTTKIKNDLMSTSKPEKISNHPRVIKRKLTKKKISCK
ncbi:MAG TPA: glycerol-3-phosphate cytidylyltransferase [Firmicutes bacterium]|nr:glycerol-3-phosphate cytidylyltransferase [Bacillota bacterium]